MKRLFAFALCCSFATLTLLANDRDVAEARGNLEGLRGMQLPKGPDSKQQIAALNKKMDAAWTFFKNHPASLSIAEEALKAEVAATSPDQFFLLDVGFLLLSQKGDGEAELAVSALEKIDPKAEIIRANWEELFHFTMKLGATGLATPRTLAQLDRLYLPTTTEINFFRAPHLVKLTPDDVRSMVYGVIGEPAAPHVAALFARPDADRKKIVPLLIEVGSEANTPAVQAVLEHATDYDTVTTCISFLMEIGGPSGRAAALAIDPAKTDAKARAYLEKIQPEIRKVNFETLVTALAEVAPGTVSDRKLTGLLDQMEKNNGQDNETPPAAIAKSGLPKEALLAQMKRIRARSFRRETNHVFEDLPITNTLINALQYK